MSTQQTKEDMMESIPLNPQTVALFRKFVEHPEEMEGCDYKPIQECFEKSDVCTPQHILFNQYIAHRLAPTLWQAGVLMVDDLCDGGGTFARLAKVLQERYPDHQRRIFVTHMVNPKGIDVLAENYHSVTFTNSYCDWRTQRPDLPENVSVVDMDKSWEYM